MSEPVIYIRGFRPPIEALTDNDDLLADLKALASVGDEQINLLQIRLNQADGFLDPKALGATVREVVEDEVLSRSVQRILRNVEPSQVPRLLVALDERNKKQGVALDESVFERLRRTLPVLIQAYPAFRRFEKAERLAKLTGQQLESVELICDIRPIFDENREHLEGLMPYTRLRVVAAGADGLPNSFEAELTLQQVHELADKASKAKEKLELLRKSAEEWLPGGLPDLPLTRAPKADSSDA